MFSLLVYKISHNIEKTSFFTTSTPYDCILEGIASPMPIQSTTKMRVLMYTRCPQQCSPCYGGDKYAYIEFNFDRKKGSCLLLCTISVTLLNTWEYKTLYTLDVAM